MQIQIDHMKKLKQKPNNKIRTPLHLIKTELIGGFLSFTKTELFVQNSSRNSKCTRKYQKLKEN